MKKADVRKDLEALLLQTNPDRYQLCLYVSGMTRRSSAAIVRNKAIGEEHRPGRHEREIIDPYPQPHLAQKEHILATPTLIKKQPRPLRRRVGQFSCPERILKGLDVRSIRETTP